MFIARTYNESNQEIKFDFYVISHGDKAGTPVKSPTANCFGIKTVEEILLPEYFYYVVMAAQQSGIYEKYIRGSVIPFITLTDFYNATLEYMFNQGKPRGT